MNNWLAKLNARERIMLFGGGAVLVVSGLYAYTYQPLIEAQQQLGTALENQQRLHTFLQSIGGEVAQLRATAPTGSSDPGQTTISLIDSSSEQAGIKSAIKRQQPEGQDNVALTLEHCPFDLLVAWLVTLDSQYGIGVRQISLSRETGDGGMVKGKVLLGRN
jgi:general secretion pathway protein M